MIIINMMINQTDSIINMMIMLLMVGHHLHDDHDDQPTWLYLCFQSSYNAFVSARNDVALDVSPHQRE